MSENNYVSIHHVSLLVEDLTIAVDFYSRVLGMSESKNRPDLNFAGAWFELGDQQLHLLKLPNPAQHVTRPEHAGRDYHFAIYIIDINDVIDRLDKAGIVYTRSRSGRVAIFCRDPDNNGIEFIQL